MSLYYFFASDTKLLEQRNPYIKLLSVNEAIAHGIEVHTELFEDPFDYDKPEVILYVEDEEQFRYPNIYKEASEHFCDELGINKKYLTCLEWDYEDKNADVVLHYIASQLENMDEIEFWKIWLGKCRNQKTPTYHSVHLKEMTKVILQSFMESENDYVCLIIKK